MDATRSSKFTFASKASAPGGNHTVELPPSLLDFVQRTYSRCADSLCIRVSIAGRLLNAEHTRRLIETCKSIEGSTEENGRKMTGLLFTVADRYFFLCCELSTLSGFKSLWKGLIHCESDQKRSTRVLSVTESVIREFAFWRHCDITAQVPSVVMDGDIQGGNKGDSDEQSHSSEGDSTGEGGASARSKDNIEQSAHFIWDSVRSVIEIGRQMRRKSDQSSAIKLLESGQRDIVNRLPTPEVLEHLLSLPITPSVSDFYRFVFSPLQFELGSEHVWPSEPDFSALDRFDSN